jgi:hypothetical protein
MTGFNRAIWKYGMILCRPGDHEEDAIHLLAEIYTIEGKAVFSKASITSPEELAMAYRDVTSDGVNRWFYDNGEFEWKHCEMVKEFRWHWEKTNPDE